MMISPLVAVTSRAALYPIQSIIIIALVVSGAYFHLLDIARNPPSSVSDSDIYASPEESRIWARKSPSGWKWTVDPSADVAEVDNSLSGKIDFQTNQIHLAWGQIGVSESSASPVSEMILKQFTSPPNDATSSSCFPIRDSNNQYKCQITSTSVAGSLGSSKEINVLLPESLNNFNSWLRFLRNLEIPDAQLVAYEGQDQTFRRGGSAAGNLVWLVQSIGKTYSRTRELVEVYLALSWLMNRMHRQLISLSWSSAISRCISRSSPCSSTCVRWAPNSG